MNRVDDGLQLPDENEPARVIACDALLRAAFSDSRSALSSAPASQERGRDRLRLLLKMLAASETDTDRSPAVGRPAEPEGRDDERPLLGRFEVIGHLGSGGFGIVVRARDLLLGREVALKVPLPERMLSAADSSRFLKEARSAGRLDHPNIVRVYDAGELGPLGYFIASEFCAGPSLRRWISTQSGPVAFRLAARLVAALAGAVQHAHDRGILHRDIKPDNVILAGGPEPDDLVPRLTDFGLAKLLEETGNETRSEARLGTPHYMAPEQAAGRHREVGPATDVYALGATLYEILTGRPPFRGETDAETLRFVLEREPVALRLLRPGLPRDLETICLKCLCKEPARRYLSADALALDLKRFLDGRPIEGRPIARGERAMSWARRRPAVAAMLALVISMACTLVGGIAAWARWLEWHNTQLEIQVARADRQTREAEKQRTIAEEGRRLAERHGYADGLRMARQAIDAHQTELAQEILHDIRSGSDGIDLRGFVWHYLWRQSNHGFAQLWGHESGITGSVLAASGTMLAGFDSRGRTVIWDLAQKGAIERPRALHTPPVECGEHIAFSPDGRIIVAVHQAAPGVTLNILDQATGQPVARLECGQCQWIGNIRFDEKSQRLAVLVVLRDGKRWILWWNIADGQGTPHSWPIPEGTQFCEMSASSPLVLAARNSRARLVDPFTSEGCVALAGPELVGDRLYAFSADGRVFAAHARNDSVTLWDTYSGRALAARPLPRNACQPTLSRTGSHLAMLNDTGHLIVFDRLTNRSRTLKGSSKRLVKSFTMSFSGDEKLLAVCTETSPGGPQPPEVWDVASGDRVRVFQGRRDVSSLAFIPGSRSLALAGGTRPRIWRLDPPAEVERLAGHADEAWTLAFSPDGRTIVTGSDDTDESQTIKLWDVTTGRLARGWKAHTATVSAVSFSPDGQLIASSSLDAGQPGHPNLLLWDARSHQQVGSLEGHADTVRCLGFSPDGRILASASDDLTIRLWDVDNRSERFALKGHTARVTALTFDSNGQTLASASTDGTVRLWDVSARQTRTVLYDRGHVHVVAFAPDGSLLASVNETGEIKLWNPMTGEIWRTIHGDSGTQRCLAFTPDGRDVAAAGDGKAIRIWDVLTGRELLSLEGHKAPINALAFSSDGSVLASCSHDGALMLWRAGRTEPKPAR